MTKKGKRRTRDEMRALYERYKKLVQEEPDVSASKAGRILGCSPTQVQNWRSGQVGYIKKAKRAPTRSAEDREAVRAMLRKGLTYSEIEKRTGISRKTLWNWKSRGQLNLGPASGNSQRKAADTETQATSALAELNELFIEIRKLEPMLETLRKILDRLHRIGG